MLAPLAGFTINTPISIKIQEIRLVIPNTNNIYPKIEPNLFLLLIWAILLDIVKNTSGTTIVNNIFIKTEPNGFKMEAVLSFNNKPVIIPEKIATNNKMEKR